MTPQQWWFAGATTALAISLAGGIPAPDRRALMHPAVVGAAALFALSLIARALFVQPTLVHADVAAPELVDCFLQFPASCMNRGASYGQYGFWFVGALAAALGRDLRALFAAMQIIGALDVALLAVLAYRLSGSPYGALLAVAVAGTNPIFMRVAASEDMHNMGLCLGLVGFIAMDVFAATRRPLALLAAVLALSLMAHTRQTFLVYAPCAFLLGLARGGRQLLKSPWFWAAGLAVLAVLVARVAMSDSGELTYQMITVLTEPALLPDMLRYHGLLDIARFGPLAALTVAAVIWACLAGGLARAVAIVLAVNFLVTYPCGMPSPGVEFAQRLSVFAVGMLVVAMAGAAVLETRIRPDRRTVTGLVAAGGLFLLPPLFPGWGTLSQVTPIHREYLGVESAAAALPEEFTLVMLPSNSSSSYGGARYAGLLGRMGKRVHTVPAAEVDDTAEPWFFLENVECWTYSFYELIGVEKEIARKQRRFEFRWDHVLFGHQPSPVRPPAAVRPQCEPLLQRTTPFGPRLVIADPPDDPPFLFYGSHAVPIQFHVAARAAAE